MVIINKITFSNLDLAVNYYLRLNDCPIVEGDSELVNLFWNKLCEICPEFEIEV
jgi:hypothetical protein